MFELESFLSAWQEAVLGEFGYARVRFLGIQGSRSRGEERPGSDIDAVLILDGLTSADAARYARCTAALPERDKRCGFIGGWAELERWPRGELWQFCLDTRPLLGSLEPIAALASGREAVREAALGSLGAVYHGSAHAILQRGCNEALGELYKGAFFALRALRCLETGEELRTRAQLSAGAGEFERAILSGALPGTAEEQCGALLDWAAMRLRRLDM